MICVINFHYQLFINFLSCVVLMIPQSAYVRTWLCMFMRFSFLFFLPPTECHYLGKFHLQSGEL